MIAENLASLFAATSLDPLNPRDPAIVKMLGLGRDTVSGVQVDEQRTLGLPAVWRGCNILGNGVAKVRPIIYERLSEGRKRATEHHNWRVITRRANTLQSAPQFRKTLTVHALLWGNGVGFINRIGDGSIRSIVPLMPDTTGMMVIREGRQLSIEAGPEPDDEVVYFTRVRDQLLPIRPENVIHIPNLSINGYWGLPAVDVLKDSFGSGLAAREFGARFFGQGATSSAVVFMPPGLKEEQQDDYISALKKGYTGLGKSHGLMVLESGSTIEKLTIPPETAQFLGTREFENREIALALGVQPHKLGDPSRKSFNSLEQSNQEHLDDDLDPWLQIWEDELEEKGLSAKEKTKDTHFVEFNRKALVRTNLEAQTNRERFEREWGLSTANQVLRRNNENPVGSVGDTYLVPQNMHVLDEHGMPLILGAEPISAGGDQGQHQRYQEVALNRVEQFINHALATARETSDSDKGFLRFLEQLPTWEKQPAVVAHLLEAVTVFMVDELTAFVDPPYKASQLQANVTAALPSIKEDAIQIVKNQLEKER